MLFQLSLQIQSLVFLYRTCTIFLIFHFRGPIYDFDPGTHDRISANPLLPDPYETQYVYVRNSKIKGAQEGLFAKKTLPK